MARSSWDITKMLVAHIHLLTLSSMLVTERGFWASEGTYWAPFADMLMTKSDCEMYLLMFR